MKGKSVIAFLGLLSILTAAGCGVPAGKQKEEVVKIPVADVTVAPTSTAPEGEAAKLPYELRFSGKEEAEEATDGDFVYFRSSLYYPVFEGSYADNMNRFVTSVTESFRESLPSAKENAKFDYEDSLSGEYEAPIFPEEEEFTVSCLWSKEQYMTLFTRCVSSTGGAHPNVFCQAYVVNLTNGFAESLEQMLKPYGLTTESVAEFVTEKLLAEYGKDLYAYDAKDRLKEDVSRFLQESQWYFNEKGLVVFANPYEIAAYARGMVECEISYEELEQGLKKYADVLYWMGRKSILQTKSFVCGMEKFQRRKYYVKRV